MLKRAYIMPRAIYDGLPYLYLALGGLLTAVLDTALKYLPAALFGLAGVIVIIWRSTSAPSPATTSQKSTHLR